MGRGGSPFRLALDPPLHPYELLHDVTWLIIKADQQLYIRYLIGYLIVDRP